VATETGVVIPILIYGATGYTGRLIAREAAARGLGVALAGRDARAVGDLARELGLPHRVFGLDDAGRIAGGLEGVRAVLHCAGPFSRTSAPMVAACLEQRVHYLDITGEVDVFEALAARSSEAARAGVVLLPGVGFDVVPSDSLAAHLARRLPSATHLDLAIAFRGGISRGTTTTMLEAVARGEGALVRRGGRLQAIPIRSLSMDVDFGSGPRPVTAASWGDVSTAYHSTGIPNITVYMAVSVSRRRWSRWWGPLQALLRVPGVLALARRVVQRGAPGPDDEARTRGSCLLWGRAVDDAGEQAISRMRTPEGYTFTVATALWAAERVAAGQVTPGFHTPTTAFGADVALEFAGVERHDVLP
jgi:short subunit dehydrogenase-like uncharacterized protein